jgi:6-pyruvoyltetrahydropterin/6-carboxytetrahydropterin synthase
MSSFQVHVTKDYLVFCAGHFITYEGSQCETLHGHNYRVAVTLNGPVDENFYVFDFTTLKKLMKRIVDELDHRMLLPLHNPLLKLQEEEDGIWVRYKERRFFFPRSDVVLLPIPNTTAEMLARHLCGRVKAELSQRGTLLLTEIAIEVEESFGQSAIYREPI